MARSAAVFGIPFGSYFLWRYTYYGYLFPNTFYAKTGGGLEQVELGLRDVVSFFGELWWIPVPLVCVALWSGYRRREIVVLASLFAGYLAYVVAVGGDFKGTYRFFVSTTVEEFSGRFAVERQLLILPDFQRNCKLVNEPLAGGYLYLFRRRTD